MDPILEHENQQASGSPKHEKGRHKHGHGKKKPSTSNSVDSGSQAVQGRRHRFLVTPLQTSDKSKEAEQLPTSTYNNAHTVHFGTRGVETHRVDVRNLFKPETPSQTRSSSAERDHLPKEYETFHGTEANQKSSLFDIFKIRRNSDARKHSSLIHNVKVAFGGSKKNVDVPEIRKNGQKVDEIQENHKEQKPDKTYYHTVTGASSSRRTSPITKVWDLFKPKPPTDLPINPTEPSKKKSQKTPRRSSIGTTSPTYHKSSYASLDPAQAKQLFREVRGLPRYDPYLSIVQISLGGRDKTRLLLNFFKYHKCYEILPKSAKVIIFDTQFLVKKTFTTLISNGIRSAPLWDAQKRVLVGMITATDFMRILLILSHENVSFEELEQHTLHTWRKMLRSYHKPLCFVGPDQSLHEAINQMTKNRVHRLLMMDPYTGDVLYVLSHKRILRFLFVYLNEFPELTFFHSKLTDLKIGTYENLATISENATIKEAFEIMLQRNISAVPIVDENDILLDIYAKYDVMNLVAEKLYFNLSASVSDVRTKHKDWEEKLQKCSSSITLYEALEIIVRTESHRLLLINKDEKLVGIVSLSDILIYLNRIIPSEKRVTSLQELFRPLEENKFTESPKENETENKTNEEDENNDIYLQRNQINTSKLSEGKAKPLDLTITQTVKEVLIENPTVLQKNNGIDNVDDMKTLEISNSKDDVISLNLTAEPTPIA